MTKHCPIFFFFRFFFPPFDTSSVFLHAADQMCHTYKKKKSDGAALLSLGRVSDAHMQKSSHFYALRRARTHTHPRTHTDAQTLSHLPNPSFPRLISSLLPSKKKKKK